MPFELNLRCDQCHQPYTAYLSGGQRVPTLCDMCRELRKKALAAVRVKRHRKRHPRGISK